MPAAELHRLLGESDYVVLSMPLTPETRGMIGEAELRAMKPTAVLVNIARGPVTVEAALIRALQEGWIAGAALDVFDQEPLPAGLAALGHGERHPHAAHQRRHRDLQPARRRRSSPTTSAATWRASRSQNVVDPARGY